MIYNVNDTTVTGGIHFKTKRLNVTHAIRIANQSGWCYRCYDFLQNILSCRETTDGAYIKVTCLLIFYSFIFRRNVGACSEYCLKCDSLQSYS